MTEAQRIADLMRNDGTIWHTDDGTTMDDLLQAAGADTERREPRPGVYFWRHRMADGSAILATEAWWDVEGSRPWVCAGAEEGGEIGLDAACGA